MGYDMQGVLNTRYDDSDKYGVFLVGDRCASLENDNGYARGRSIIIYTSQSALDWHCPQD